MSQITRKEVQEMLKPLGKKMLEKARQKAHLEHTSTRKAVANLGFAQNTPYRWRKGEILRVDRAKILTKCFFQGLLTEAGGNGILAKLDAFWTNEWGKNHKKKEPEPLILQIPTIAPAVTFEEVIVSAESFKDSLQACNQRKKEFLELFDAWREKVAHGFSEMVHFRNTMEGILNSRGGSSEK